MDFNCTHAEIKAEWAGSEGRQENNSYFFENMEFLDEADTFLNTHSDDEMNEREEAAVIFDFFIEAHEREFKAQKKGRSLQTLHIQANDKQQFEQQIWLAFSSVLRREILYQRAEEGCEEQVEWSPVTKPSWEDRNRYFRLQYKRNTLLLLDLNDDFLESLTGLTVKLAVLIYSDSLITAKN